MASTAGADGARREERALRAWAAVATASAAGTAALLVWMAVADPEGAVPALAALVLLAVTAAASLVGIRRARRARTGRTEVFESIAALTDPALMRFAPDELAGELLVRVHRAIRPDLAGVGVHEGDGSDLRMLALRSAEGVEPSFTVPSQPGLLTSVATNAEPVLAHDTTAVQVGEGFASRAIRSFAGCPMHIEGRVIGVAFMTSARPNAFDLDDLRLLQRVADRLALALERERLDTAEQLGRTALAEGEARLRSLVEAAPLGIVELSVEGRVERWNPAVCELLDWPPFSTGVAPPVLDGELASVVHDVATRTRRGRTANAKELRIERRGGPPVTVSLSGAPLRDAEGHVAGVIVLIGDVTERRQMEQQIRQAQRLDAMSRLAGGVAHDFNNLLTVVVGYSQFLLQQLPPDSPIREDIEAIGKAGTRASELTNQLLTIGRRQVVEPVVLDVQERVADLEPVIRRLIGDDVDLRVVTGRGAANVRVDPHEFEQVVMNLCINARDAMPSGGRLVLESRGIDLDGETAGAAGLGAGSYVLITVADTGTGMSEEVREHCFDPFFTTKGRGKGTGLGLAAVYGVVSQAGGHLDVVSEVGRGTTFRLYFPVATGGAAPVVARKAAGKRRSTRKGRVLLVEDEPAVRKLARAVLEEQGHTVVESESAEAALALAKRVQEPYDVLVSDIVMPGMHGDALARELSAMWPSLRVLLVSGYAERAEMIDGDRMRFLAKPFALDELADTVAELVPRKTARKAAKTGASSGAAKKAPVPQAGTGAVRRPSRGGLRAQQGTRLKPPSIGRAAARAKAGKADSGDEPLDGG
ncbi:MAG TPA: ATP-binding protein [Acidimicrobiales bacterium]|nr:ATP-binding protein [Acidimicrobiales bacterium]